ncbi:alpha/beta fold hydrolase [Streptomyces paludis]|uniref:Alpha/beta hydrolase n=1 Tax=Streptomyces paludis TaxID=2282738 RepID=A0A345I1S4_9ACTN|nr:alpha/beta fold hydrolase [Streptomyces paludis]AXG82898.1 alpha/beta hydrolase [Streptomyces paludis]
MCMVNSGDATPIAFRRTGEGPPVVLVGGAFSTAESEAPLAKLLAPAFDVITYDRRGRGASGDTAPYAVEREIEDLAALLGMAGPDVSVLGMSSGAALVLEAAAAGLPMAQFALYEPPYVLGGGVDGGSGGISGGAGAASGPAYSERLAGLLARGLRDDAVELFLRAVGTAGATVGGLRRSPMWPDLTALAHTLAYDDAVLRRGPLPAERLSAVRVRAMVVDGGASPRFLRDAARATAAALPRGRHRTLTGQTHEVAPHVLAPVLEEFFAA